MSQSVVTVRLNGQPYQMGCGPGEEAHIEALAKEATAASGAFVDYEDPSFWVMEMGKDGIRCWVAGWADTPADAWTLTHDVRTKLSMALHANGITCHSFNHRVQSEPPAQLTTPSTAPA